MISSSKQQFSRPPKPSIVALKEDPTSVPAWTLRGKMAMAFNRFDIATSAFRKAVRLDPIGSECPIHAGLFLLCGQRFRKAVPVLETALRLNPDDARSLFYLAMSNEGLARPEPALTLYEKTIALETLWVNQSGNPHRLRASPFFVGPNG